MSDNMLLVATKNKGKLKEIQEILTNYTIIGMQEAGFTHETVEDGLTFEDNAYKKASELAAIANLPVLADDSGLIADALDGRPGVYSARFAGERATDSENIQKLLDLMKNIPETERTARFVCAMCLVYPDGSTITARGECEGRLLTEKRGENGFGYDPVFYVSDYGKTFAELDSELKNRISHRRKALEKLSEMIP